MDYVKNGVIYKREVDHCGESPYIKLVTIKDVTSAANSDFLESITFEEIGWCTISQKGLHTPGEKVLFIPAESVLPFELGERLEVTKYLSNGRVRSARFRGNRSEGIIVEPDIVDPWLPHILKWEDLPTMEMEGKAVPAYMVSPYFHKFHDMPNILNEPYIFRPDEKIFYSEKLHGTSARFGIFKNPHNEKYTVYVGGHNRVFEESDNIYWRIYREYLEGKLPKDIEFFGEIFGPGIQDLKYGLKSPDVRIFAATRRGYYINATALGILCSQHNIPMVNFGLSKFRSVDALRKIANNASEYTDVHMSEGIVIVSAEYPDRMAKCKSDAYEERRNKKERH